MLYSQLFPFANMAACTNKTNHLKIKLTYCPSNILNINTFTDKSGQVRLYGIMHKVAQLLASSLGASFSLQPPADRQWGAINIKGFSRSSSYHKPEYYHFSQMGKRSGTV